MSDDLVRVSTFRADIGGGLCKHDKGTWVRLSDYEEAADRIEELEKACKKWAEVSQSNYQRAKAAEAKLAEMLVVGNVMAASIEGNYYIAGIATKWKEIAQINGVQP